MTYRQDEIRDSLRIHRIQEAAGDAAANVWLADWRAYRLARCTLYLVSPDCHWPCKVGISANGRQRVSQIQMNVWRPVKCDYSVWCHSTADARRLEKALHEELTADGKWLTGEWFDMRAGDARELVAFKASVLGIEAFDRIEEPEIIADIGRLLTHYSKTGLASRLPRDGA